MTDRARLQRRILQLEQERARMLDWLAHQDEHFPPICPRLGISDCVMEEALILHEIELCKARLKILDWLDKAAPDVPTHALSDWIMEETLIMEELKRYEDHAA